MPLQVPLAVYHRVSILQRCKPARSRACTLAHPCSASSLAIERVRAHTYSPHIGARQILFLAHIYTGLCTFSMHAHAHTADSVSHIYSLIGPHLHSPVHAHTCTRQILFLAIFDAIWLRILHRHGRARTHTPHDSEYSTAARALRRARAHAHKYTPERRRKATTLAGASGGECERRRVRATASASDGECERRRVRAMACASDGQGRRGGARAASRGASGTPSSCRSSSHSARCTRTRARAEAQSHTIFAAS